MVKGASNLRLFFPNSAKKDATAGDKNSPHDASVTMDGRVPLSPRTNIAAGPGAQQQPKMELLATPRGKKGGGGPGSSGLSSHKFQHCENMDSSSNLSYTAAAAASTPEAKQLHFPPPATPKSNVKKRLGWNPKQQLPNEQDSGGAMSRSQAEANNPVSDSASSTSSDVSTTGSSSSLQSVHGISSSSADNSQSTPRTQLQSGTPSRGVPKLGRFGAVPSPMSGNPKATAAAAAQRAVGTMNPQATKVAAMHQSSEAHFELQEDPHFWTNHNVQVLVRVRPMSNSDVTGHSSYGTCLRQDSAHTITWIGQPQTRFTFDHVAGEFITQENLFRVAGLPMVENCMAGYNSSMFAYGQTGSGKTHTMLGDIDNLAYRPSEQRGMTPRIFEYMFSRILAEEQEREHEQLKYVCKCSFLEIYNEQITDLLEPTSTNLQIREDFKTGVYVENLREVQVTCVQDVVQLLVQGAANRKVAATNMNRESSRSHSVFACSVQSTWESNSLTNVRYGRLNLVDLAGSERQRTSGAEGDRLKEAANINKSLSTLGLVIMILVDVANGKQRHVPYRDSKLTFLLQDSLGGNSKTTVIATVSPSNSNAAETLSTLKFAQRAKFIRNNAVINEDASGDIAALQREIQQLKEEVSRLRRRSISTMVRYETEPGASNPGLSTNAALKKIEAMEVLLAGALRREKSFEAATKQMASEVKQLNSLVQQREQNTQSGKMILRFREDKIQRLESLVEGKLTVDSYLVEENGRLKEELQLVRSQIDRNPELTKFAMENIRLIEQLQGYQEFYNNGERETLLEEILNLRDQVLEIMDAKLALEQGAVALSTTQADNYRRELEICCNDLSTCLDINAKKTKQVEELQSKVEQLSARCAEQQQELELLKAIPVPEKGQIDELQLERAVHLQIISDLRAQLQQKEEIAGVQQSKKDIVFEDANQGDDSFTQMSHDQPTSTELELPMTSNKVSAVVAEKELCLLDN
ncbi:unnamed protein product [Sphagnum jensenii]|uniref:Kinesin-like protein n=1 Tax=Sphagnum jensenii TaxID=128206 RepID=A0ABP1B2K9_9BRYO